MSKVLIIGAGGVGRVAVHKCAEADTFSEICLASRTGSKCERIAADLEEDIRTEQIDAQNLDEVTELIEDFAPEILIHAALPYQNEPIMEACLETGTSYLDTALTETEEEPDAFYGPQWEYGRRYRDTGIVGILGCGFDPGVTNVFCAYAQKHLFDEIHTVDIADCNGGNHGLPFATNFNPEINLRELCLPGRYWENGRTVEIRPMSVHEPFDYPEIGPRESYLIWHEEIESLVKHIKGLKRVRFWMTFSDSYIEHLRVLENIGMTGVDPVEYQGRPIVPIKFLKELLPDPSSLAQRYTGKTCIGCIFQGVKDGKERKVYIYNVCDHRTCYEETGAQAISYTTGVPAMIGAKLAAEGPWNAPGVWNAEQLDPDPFMAALREYGLPWHIRELNLADGFSEQGAGSVRCPA